jgi:hypothetical protein
MLGPIYLRDSDFLFPDSTKGTDMHRSPWLPIAVAVAVFALPRIAAGQEHPPEHQAAPACPAGQECPMHPDTDAMQARHEAMMQQHEQSAARIQELQDRMHAVTGEAKVQAIEALLDEMLAQQRAMHAMMMGMHDPTGMGEGMKHDEMAPEPEPDAD